MKKLKKLSKVKFIKIFNKEIDKVIFEYVLSAIVFTLLLVGLTIVITNKYIESNIQKVYVDNGFMIQINPKINGQLEILSDIEGLKTKNNVINITNNNFEEKRYQILLTPLNDDENNIRVLLDNSLLRMLSNFKKEDNKYLIGEYPLPSQQTRIHTISLWQDKQEQNKKINVNFKLEVKILN